MIPQKPRGSTIIRRFEALREEKRAHQFCNKSSATTGTHVETEISRGVGINKREETHLCSKLSKNVNRLNNYLDHQIVRTNQPFPFCDIWLINLSYKHTNMIASTPSIDDINNSKRYTRHANPFQKQTRCMCCVAYSLKRIRRSFEFVGYDSSIELCSTRPEYLRKSLNVLHKGKS